MNRLPLLSVTDGAIRIKKHTMQEINPIKNQIADLKSRGNALRGYL